MALFQFVSLAISILNTMALVGFGYFFPAVSSIRAVIHRDVESYHQWVSYWLIFHFIHVIIEPILQHAVHPMLKIVLVMWLSLPRYQGASYIYIKIVIPLFDKHEELIDDRIRGAKQHVKSSVIRSVSGTGYTLLQHAMTAVTTVTSGQPSDDSGVAAMGLGLLANAMMDDNQEQNHQEENTNVSIITNKSDCDQHSDSESLTKSSSMSTDDEGEITAVTTDASGQPNDGNGVAAIGLGSMSNAMVDDNQEQNHQEGNNMNTDDGDASTRVNAILYG